jgi:hypothetical protein
MPTRSSSSPLDRLRRAVAARLGAALPARARPPAPARKRRARRPRDAQRARVYRWEAAHVFPHAGSPLTLEGCRALVEAAYRWAEAPAEADPLWRPPLVTDGRGRRHACGSREVVKLPRWARTPAVVLHECAHGLAPRDMHGPAFVAAYVALLERFAGLDAAALRASLAAAGVAVAPPRPP